MTHDESIRLSREWALQYRDSPLNECLVVVAMAYTRWLRDNGFEITSYLSGEDHARQVARFFAPRRHGEGAGSNPDNRPGDEASESTNHRSNVHKNPK